MRKFAIEITPHLNCVAALPCEMSNVLKATSWRKLSQRVIDRAIGQSRQWNRRLKCVVQQHDGSRH